MRLQAQQSAILVQTMEARVGRLCEVLGGCERIPGTPVPFTYGVIIHPYPRLLFAAAVRVGRFHRHQDAGGRRFRRLHGDARNDGDRHLPDVRSPVMRVQT